MNQHRKKRWMNLQDEYEQGRIEFKARKIKITVIKMQDDDGMER